MANISSIWRQANDYSYLFSSSSSSTKSSTDILGIDYAEYASITKGSYSKLLKAYYKKYGNDATLGDDDSTESKATKNNLKSNASALYEAASKLVTNGKESLFNKVEKTDETTGETTTDYDKDKIYKAVSEFVDSYNSMIKSSTDSDDNAVLRQTVRMVNAVSANGSLLGEVGIKIGSDNTLSVDEETFKNAEMGTVKTLFSGNSSLAGRIQSAASNIYLNVNNSLGNSSSYTATGTFSNYTTGSILDSLL